MQKINSKSLQLNIGELWKVENIGKVNDNNVRFRKMKNFTANWHHHDDSDELFFVINGVVNIDTKSNSFLLEKNDLLVIPAGIEHRARVQGEASLLIVDQIQK